MPEYEFSCRGCGARRDVRAGHATAVDLELICVHCGDIMTKAITRSFLVASRQAPPPGAAPALRTRVHTHADGAVRLTRPNPFRKALAAGEEG